MSGRLHALAAFTPIKRVRYIEQKVGWAAGSVRSLVREGSLVFLPESNRDYPVVHPVGCVIPDLVCVCVCVWVGGGGHRIGTAHVEAHVTRRSWFPAIRCISLMAVCF